MNERGLNITKIKVLRAIISAVFIYFLIAYILSGRGPKPSIANLIEFIFLVGFVSIMFIGHGFISVYFQRLGEKPIPAFWVRVAEFVVNLLYILLLSFLFFYLPMKTLYPGKIAPPDVLRLAHGIFILVGFTHYYLLERERSEQILSKVQLETEKVAKENFEARLLMLKKHLNPQFLYHSLKRLKQFVKEDKPKARLYLRKLSEIYRLFLHQVDQHVVSLRDERDLLQSYAELLQMEYGDQIEFINQLPEEEESFYLPSGLCQIILEDWIACLSNKEGLKLQIALKQQDQALVLSGKFSQPVALRQQESIRHIQRTYQLQTQGTCTPEISEGPDFSTISLPLFPAISPTPAELFGKD